MVGQVLDGVFVLEQLEVPDSRELEVLVHDEVLVDNLFDSLPMPHDGDGLPVLLDLGLLFHSLVLQLGQQRDEGPPLLDVLVKTQVGVHLTVEAFDFKQRLSELLDLVVHLNRVEGVVLERLVRLELLLADLDVVPQLGDEVDLDLDRLEVLGRPHDGFWEVEHLRRVLEAFELLVEAVDLLVDLGKALRGSLVPSLILEDGFLLESLEVVFQLLLELREVVLGFVGLGSDVGRDVLLDCVGHLLEVVPVVLQLDGFLEVAAISVRVVVLSGQRLEGLLDDLDLQEDLLSGLVDPLQVRLDREQHFDVRQVPVFAFDVDGVLAIDDVLFDVVQLFDDFVLEVGPL